MVYLKCRYVNEMLRVQIPFKTNYFDNQILWIKFGIYIKEKDKDFEVVYLKLFFSNKVCEFKSCQVTFGK